MDMNKENNDLGMNNEFDEQLLDALILEALNDDILVSVPDGFADLMEEKAKQINVFRFWKEELLKQISFFGGAILMLTVAFGVLYYFKAESLSEILIFLNKYKWLLLGAITLFFGIQIADTWVFKRLGEDSDTRKLI